MKNNNIYEFLFIWVVLISSIGVVNLYAERNYIYTLQDVCIAGAFFISGFNIMMLIREIEEKKKNDRVCNKE